MATGRVPTTANSPLTAKGDLFTYDTSPARLAVGNNGETLVADSSQSTGLRWGNNYGFTAGKNKLINGDFNINQRNFSSTTTSNTYGHDRWQGAWSGGTVTYSNQTFTLGTAPVSGYEAKQYARIVTSGQSAAGDAALFYQPVESVRVLAGQTATYSFWAKASSGTPKIALEIEQGFGSGGSPSATVDTYVAQVTLSTSWQRYSVTMSVPSISGKTLGTNNNDVTSVLMWISAGTNFNARTGSLGIQNTTIDIWGCQWEAGSVATAFQTATGTLAGELAACQRYYWRWTVGDSTASNYSLASAWALSSTQAAAVVVMPVSMRARVSSIETTGTASNYKALIGGTNYTCTSVPVLDQTHNERPLLLFTTGGTMTTGQGGMVSANSNQVAYIGFNAEL